MKAFPAMTRLLVVLGAATCQSRAVAQEASSLSGAWTLNRSLSELPREIGFNVAWLPAVTGSGQSSEPSGGRGRRASGGGGGSGSGIPNSIPRESSEDARRLQFITSEARNPPTRLTIVDTTGAVTITTELGQSRTLHPTGRDEALEIQGVPFITTTKREGNQLVTAYRVEEGRTVRYTYSRSSGPSQLVVEVQFIEKGSVEKAKRIYEPATQTETLLPPGASQQGAAPPAPAAPAPATGRREEFDARPGAELKGLNALGILVEDLGSQAVACGLVHDTLENTLAKRLSDAGLTVKKNSDEDTYVYVNVMTSSLPNGTCVSRYDAFLYTHATARLSYGAQPVLVQISLMHRGSIGSSSAPGTHAAAVTRGLEGYVDLFITQIRAANRSDKDQR